MNDQEENQPAPLPREIEPQQLETLQEMQRTLGRIAQMEPGLLDNLPS